MGHIRSADGTAIAYERAGTGPPLVMVDPAGGWSGFDTIRGLGELLAQDLTVTTYERRGRGASGDTAPYEIEREIEDLAVLVGDGAAVYGMSSGGLLALHAAAAGVPIERLVLFEPPVRPEGEPPDLAFCADIAALTGAGRHMDAALAFLSGIGVPDEVLDGMDAAPLAAVAPTLVYDCEISNATTFALLRRITTPALVLDSAGSSDDLTGGTAAIAAALPAGERHSLPGGWHGVDDAVLAPVVAAFCTR